MDTQKILRWLIYFFIGIILLSSLLIWINDFMPRIHPEEQEPVRDQEMDDRMKGMYTMPPIRANVGRGGQPADTENDQVGEKPTESTSMVVKMKGNFQGVAEKPKNPMQAIIDLSKPKKPVVSMDESDLDSEIMLEPSAVGIRLEAADMPNVGIPAENSGIAMISVPVDYKIFSDSAVWKAFADAHKTRFENDFAKKSVVVLVSLSNFPPGIFAIREVKTEKGQTTVYYTVNPLMMSEGIEEDMRNQYAVAAIPKGTKKVNLVQVRQEYVSEEQKAE